MKVTCIVHPKATNTHIVKNIDGTIHIYIHEPPHEGKANKASIAALADFFHIKKKNVTLLSGVRSKQKVFEILS